MAMVPLAITPIHLAETPAEECFKLLSNKLPSEIALRVPCSGGLLNFGALTFKSRLTTWGNNPDLIDLETYDEDHAVFAKEFAITLAERYYIGDSAHTIRRRFLNTREVIDWADSNNHSRIFESCNLHHTALIDYSVHLRSKVCAGLGHNAACYRLACALNMNILAFPDNDYNFLPGVYLLGYSRDGINHTQPPGTDELEAFIRPLSDIFANVHRFLSTDKRLPYSFSIGEEIVWLLHDNQVFMSETAIRGDIRDYGMTIWKILKDRALSRMEIFGGDFHNSLHIEMEKFSHTRLIKFKNNNAYRKRNHTFPEFASEKALYDLCRLAHNCFLFMFTLATASNAQPLQNIVWDEFSYTARGAQNQRVIKNRANKKVNIGFEARFAKEFDCYLAIRKVLVGDYDFKYLFGQFVFGKPPKILHTQYASSALHSVKKFIFPELNLITMRALRAYHLEYKRNEYGVHISAAAGGHTLRTSLDSYTSGNPEVNIEEAAMFFTEVGDRAREIIARSSSITSGECTDNLQGATTHDDSLPIIPDCKNFLGCLSCKKFFIHLNDQDIRKILSMRYLIEQFKRIQTSPDEFDNYWGPSLSRLNFIIDRIKEISDELNNITNRITIEVYENEDLSPYWQHKLDVLLKIGVLA